VVNDGIQQTAQALLVRLVLAGIIEPLLKFAESLQPVMLLRKPCVQCVHGSLFLKEEEATNLYSLGRASTNAVFADP
jgi:hypothetical protein